MSAPSRLALLVAYDGAPYSGWQLQPGRPTVQGELEGALRGLLGAALRVHGSGRTDAGVHALGQVAHVDLPARFPAARLAAALNARLPPAIRVRAARVVPPDFHALHSALRKTYAYRFHLSHAPGGRAAVEADLPPARRGAFHPVPARLDLRAMREAAARLRGTHDFQALSRAMPAGRSTVKTLMALRLLRGSRSLLVLASGDGFLYGMVRLLAGGLLDVGLGRCTPDRLAEILASRDRALQPTSLPAHALCLLRVDYPVALLGGVARADGLAHLRPAILGPALLEADAPAPASPPFP